MHDSPRMGGGEPVGDGGADLEGFLPRQVFPGEPPVERLTPEKLRDREDDSVRVAEIVDREDVRVRKRRDGACLLLEPA